MLPIGIKVLTHFYIRTAGGNWSKQLYLLVQYWQVKPFWLPLALDTFCLSSKFILHPATLPPCPRASWGLPATWFLFGFGQWVAPAGDWWKREFIPIAGCPQAGWPDFPKLYPGCLCFSIATLSVPFLDPAGKYTYLPSRCSVRY